TCEVQHQDRICFCTPSITVLLLGMCYSIMILRPTRRTLFPYTTLFRSEASMLDTRLAASLFQSVPAEAHLLLVGDIDQLPSVGPDRKSTRLNSSHVKISYAVFCLKKKKR